MILERHREEHLQPRPLVRWPNQPARLQQPLSHIFDRSATSDHFCRRHFASYAFALSPAVVSIRSRSVSASTRITSAAAPRRSTSSAPSARRVPRRVPSPVVEEAEYIPYEDAVSSDGEVPRCDDRQQQMAEMRREMAAMHNSVHVMASTTA